MQELLFIHVPKTGGISVRALGWSRDWGHCTAEQIRADLGADAFARMFKFAFWRNPFARLVSGFFFFRQLTPRHEWYEPNRALVEIISGFRSFTEFVHALEPDGLGGFYHFWPQHRYLTVSGRLAVNFLGRTERMADDLAMLGFMSGRGVPEVPRLNGSQHEPWLKFYTPATLARVAWHYRDDFDLLEQPLLKVGEAI